MKRSNIVRLSLLIAVAAVLTVVFLLLRKQKETPTDLNKVTYFTVMTIDVNRVNKISLKSKNYEGIFRKSEDSWLSDTDVLNQKIVRQIPEQLLANLKAIAKVDNPAADTEYGLAEPSAVLEAYDGEQRMVRIELGDKVPTKNCYYCRFNGEKTVYTVAEVYARLLLGEASYYTDTMNLPDIPDIKNVQEVILTGELFPNFHVVKTEKNEYDYSGTKLFPWYFLSPYRSQWDADIINGPWMDQLEMYIKVYAEEIHPAKPDEFAKYGLTNPGATLTVRYADDTGTEKASYTLLIGDQVPDSENYYAKLEGMDAVLILSRFRVEAMCKIDIFSTTYKPLMYPGINVLSKITATAGDVKIVFTHEKSGDKDVYAINGVVIEGSEAFAWAQKMLTLRSSAYNPVDTPQGEPILVIEAEPLNPDVNKPMTVRVFRDGSGNDIIEKLGYCDCAIDSRLIDEFINYMKGLQGGN